MIYKTFKEWFSNNHQRSSPPDEEYSAEQAWDERQEEIDKYKELYECEVLKNKVKDIEIDTWEEKYTQLYTQFIKYEEEIHSLEHRIYDLEN